jgi:hypothetical protein
VLLDYSHTKLLPCINHIRNHWIFVSPIIIVNKVLASEFLLFQSFYFECLENFIFFCLVIHSVPYWSTSCRANVWLSTTRHRGHLEKDPVYHLFSSHFKFN